MTAALIVLVFVAMNFADNELTLQMARGEFSSGQEFMQSTGAQMDNVAWTIGRTETVDYTANYGQVTFAPNVLDYTFEVSNNNGVSWQLLYNCTTGMVLYNMPAGTYSLGNNYFSRIIPADNGSFLQWGVSAPVYQVFAVEKVPSYGNYARIVAVPTVRALNSLISSESYYEFYLPSLVNASSPYLSKSITLTGSNLNMATPSSSINEVRINATSTSTIPLSFSSFNSAFFNFTQTTETVSVPSGSLVEIYNGDVAVAIGTT